MRTLELRSRLVDEHPYRRVGIRELRRSLAHVVAAAVGGERITITLRGAPAAVLGPIEPSTTGPTLETLAAAGLIEPPRRTDRPRTPAPMSAPVDVRLDRVLDRLRGRR
jgi:prevent-host-death family protein